MKNIVNTYLKIIKQARKVSKGGAIGGHTRPLQTDASISGASVQECWPVAGRGEEKAGECSTVDLSTVDHATT